MRILDIFVGFFKINRSPEVDNEEEGNGGYLDTDEENGEEIETEEQEPPVFRRTPSYSSTRHSEMNRSNDTVHAERNIGRGSRLSSFSRSNNITPVPPVKEHHANMELSHVKPSTFNDATFIADCIKAEKVVILNMDGMDNVLAQRIIDFASGVAYYADGKLKRITGNIFIVAPEIVSMSGKYDEISSTDPMSIFSDKTM